MATQEIGALRLNETEEDWYDIALAQMFTK